MRALARAHPHDAQLPRELDAARAELLDRQHRPVELQLEPIAKPTARTEGDSPNIERASTASTARSNSGLSHHRTIQP